MATYKEQADRISHEILLWAQPALLSGRPLDVTTAARQCSGEPLALLESAETAFRTLIHNPAGGATLWLSPATDVSVGVGFPIPPGWTLELCSRDPASLFVVADPGGSGAAYYVLVERARA